MEKYVACAAGGVDVGGVPEEIRLLPLGHVHSQKGDFLVDEESFRMIEKKFLGKKVDLVIDYEHQTLKDVQAPAGGWIKRLSLGTDAIMAKVEWTPRAKEYIANKEYRYLSPVIMVRKSDKRAASIHSAALTNTPAIEGMFAIANSLDIDDLEEMEEIHMDLAKVAKKLGLPETASEEDVLKALDGVLDPGGKKNRNRRLKTDRQRWSPTARFLVRWGWVKALRRKRSRPASCSLRPGALTTGQRS